jgi:hypothetical protein
MVSSGAFRIKMGRPLSLRPTEQKTWMFYSEDVETCFNSGKAPKDIFKLGCQALAKGWNEQQVSQKETNLELRVSKLSTMLELYISKFNDLSQIIEDKLKIDVGSTPANIDLLKKRLQELHDLEQNIVKKEKNIKK